MAHNRSLHWHMMKRIVGLALTLLAIHIGMPPQAFAQPPDAKGSRDHKGIKRYPGSYIIGFEAQKFGELMLPLGRSEPVKDRTVHAYQYSKSQPVEGELTRILYVAPEGRSSLEILRNYEQALTMAGFQTLFACTDQECDSAGNVHRFENLVYPQARQLKNRGQLSGMAFGQPKDLRYLAAQLTAPGKEVYVSLMVAVETFTHFKETANHPLVLLEVVETKPMEKPPDLIDPKAWQEALTKDGRVALYGIYFETGEAKILAKSEPTLDGIGKLLKQDRALKLYVVGHTDNDGDFDYNMRLSNQRAKAVMDHLVTRYGVEATRLKAGGVGPLAPVASNDSKDSKAKNRRVELVKQ